MLYAQYWPEDVGAMYGETEVEFLELRFGIDSPCTVIRTYKDTIGNDKGHIPGGHKVLVISGQLRPHLRGFSQNKSDLHLDPRLSAYLHHIRATLSEPCWPTPLTKFNPVPLWEVMGLLKDTDVVTDTRSKTRNREETHKERAVLWEVLEN